MARTDKPGKAALKALWQLARAYLFYPVMIGLFIWFYVTKAHWIFGAAVIAAILILDPIWRILARQIAKTLSRQKK